MENDANQTTKLCYFPIYSNYSLVLAAHGFYADVQHSPDEVNHSVLATVDQVLVTPHLPMVPIFPAFLQQKVDLHLFPMLLLFLEVP